MYFFSSSSRLYSIVHFVVYLLIYLPLLHPSCFYVNFFFSFCYTPVFLFLWCFLSAFTECILPYLTSHLFTFLSLSCVFSLILRTLGVFFCFIQFSSFCSWKWYKQQYNPQLKYQLAYLYLSSGFLHHFLLWITWNLRFNHCTHFLLSQPSE